MFYRIKCRKCRKLIVEDSHDQKLILTCHGIPLGNTIAQDCSSEDSVVYLNDDYLPSWIKDKIEEVNWTKSRINCPGCDCRIGAFDFVSGTKCNCKTHMLPATHIIKSKVDLIKLNEEG
ncbi:hypothetical protein GWI33_008347 [Rhynchophorus ferrugineus]|uniref:Uncharacterized protein n=1 Tax=Rhynchophorus ferrugineus TaxID=354439 RepID=A0A834IRL5_RHYFE|nr:hypothetical protein GWI33_008347 [Rhynchophorus ferrugineus]